VAGYHNDIPAKRRLEGLPCTPATQLTLTGIPADQAIHLAWEVKGTLPVTSTWEIAYDGQPSPITGLPAPARAYTLTGLTNYTWYVITLTNSVDSTPFLTGTVRVMPTDIFVHLPVVMTGP
jgi:hypothetical protein